jgi:hypothetical protein
MITFDKADDIMGVINILTFDSAARAAAVIDRYQNYSV